MRYLLALAVVLCLAGCATTSTTQATSQNQTITIFYSDQIVYME
jgi:ABC-type glycerol-3-phosphate transport system substrate-binding protein